MRRGINGEIELPKSYGLTTLALLMRSAARFGQDWREYIPSLGADDMGYAVGFELVEADVTAIRDQAKF